MNRSQLMQVGFLIIGFSSLHAMHENDYDQMFKMKMNFITGENCISNEPNPNKITIRENSSPNKVDVIFLALTPPEFSSHLNHGIPNKHSKFFNELRNTPGLKGCEVTVKGNISPETEKIVLTTLSLKLVKEKKSDALFYDTAVSLCRQLKDEFEIDVFEENSQHVKIAVQL